MTERKPGGVTWQTFVDRQIEAGRAEGLFDDLRGAGKPLADLDRPHDDAWWIRRKLEREEVQFLPETLQVRKDLDDARRRIDAAGNENDVRAIAEKINERIRWVNSHAVAGPPSTVMPIDVEATVQRWRAAHPDAPAADAPVPATAPAGTSPRRWWRRRRRSTTGSSDRTGS